MSVNEVGHKDIIQRNVFHVAHMAATRLDQSRISIFIMTVCSASVICETFLSFFLMIPGALFLSMLFRCLPQAEFLNRDRSTLPSTFQRFRLVSIALSLRRKSPKESHRTGLLRSFSRA